MATLITGLGLVGTSYGATGAQTGGEDRIL